MEEFFCRTRIVSGAGAMEYLRGLGIRRLYLVADPFFVKNTTADRVIALSGAEHYEIFSDIRPDPGVDLAARGTARVKEFGPDAVVALGGGSALDCAKAMVYFSGLQPRFIAIPTTSGSGSEVTDFAILTHGDTKHPLVDPRLCPDTAILDSCLLEALPGSLVADTGFDVLSHALEAYVASEATPVTDALARDAFCTAYAQLPASFAGDTAVRGSIHMASTMAGMAFSQAGLGLCHALAHSLGGQFHVPHGRLNAILLPAVIRCNAHAAGAKYAKLSRSAGLTGMADSLAVRNLINALSRLRQELELPGTLAQAGIDPGEVRFRSREIVNAVLEDPCCRTNPMKVADFMVRQVLEAVTGRG